MNGIVIHALASYLWMKGLTIAMTAFEDGEFVWVGQTILAIHNIVFFPIVVAEYFGLPLTAQGLMKGDTLMETFTRGGIGPQPSIASVAWCLIVGWICWWCGRRFSDWCDRKAESDGLPSD